MLPKLTTLDSSQLDAISRLASLIKELRAISYNVSVIPSKAKNAHGYLNTSYRESIESMKAACSPWSALESLGLAEFEKEYEETLFTLEAIARKEEQSNG